MTRLLEEAFERASDGKYGLPEAANAVLVEE